MDRMNGLKFLALASALALGSSFVFTGSVKAEDAAKPAPAPAAAPKHEKHEGKKEAKKDAKLNLGSYAQWAKDLGLDEATQAKLAEINTKQEEANKENNAKLAELSKNKEAKKEDVAKVRADIAKVNAEYRVKAFGVLSPEQQKKVTVSAAYKQVTMTNPFKSLTLSAEQQKKINDKLEAAGDSILNESKEVDSKKLTPIIKSLQDEVLTADQKAEVNRIAEENKAKAAGKKEEAKAGKPEAAPKAEKK